MEKIQCNSINQKIKWSQTKNHPPATDGEGNKRRASMEEMKKRPDLTKVRAYCPKGSLRPEAVDGLSNSHQ